ncbi:MAG: GntR family transcriptional regulator, partial [Balneolales bacterium]
MKKSKPSLSERVYYTLYNRINNGDYAEDPRLPSEYELSESFGVSRPVLRTALEKLRNEGVIVSRQGAGNFVQVQSISQLGFAR